MTNPIIGFISELRINRKAVVVRGVEISIETVRCRVNYKEKDRENNIYTIII